MLHIVTPCELGRPCRSHNDEYGKQVEDKEAKLDDRESDYVVVLRKQGNACGGKGVTW